MDAYAAPETHTLLNDSAIIGLIRNLLAPEPFEDTPQPGASLKLPESVVDDARDRAGCMLWDMAAVQEHATVMAENLILDILPELILDPDSPDRLVEISAGILGNMACHKSLQSKLAEHPQLQQSVLQGALMRDDAGCICEACRVLSAMLAGSHAEAWLRQASTEGIASRVAWLLEATQNSDVLIRVCEFVAAMASAGSLGAQVLISNGILSRLRTPLRDFGKLTSAGRRTDWDDEGPDADGDFPSLPAMEAVLDTLEAMSEDDCGSAAMSADRDLQQQLVQLMDGRIELLLRGRAAVLLASLQPGSTDLLAQDDAATMLLVQLLLDAPISEHGPVFQDAAWTLLARVLQLLQPAAAANGQQKVFNALGSKANIIYAAARELGKGADLRRARRASLVAQMLSTMMSEKTSST